MLKDLEHELWDDRGNMPNIDRVGQKSLVKTRGREIGKDIKAIFTLIGKKNCLGYEVYLANIERQVILVSYQ